MSILITECPRDAMQGLHTFIPTEQKVAYLNTLLTAGFNVLDYGSFVSPKAIPQMKDTADTTAQLIESKTELLAIVANERGALDALSFDKVSYLGFPLSVSETFQQRNTRKSIAEALENVKKIHGLCEQHGRKLQVYLSMAFGNPYGDPYDETRLETAARELSQAGIKTIALADTIGVATAPLIKKTFAHLTNLLSDVHFSAHLHTRPNEALSKLEAAYEGGCRHFESALKGLGGCPMAQDGLVGNVATEQVLAFAKKHNIKTHVNETAYQQALQAADKLFSAFLI